jgi:menaquinone-specific isochorismate synthase
LRLAERLHPTPAVGGVPTDDALRWIADHEPTERGWYAAPIGWFDDAGDGEFDVALRSGVLLGDEAFLFAGAGIVQHSDPASEYAETELKLASLSSALGLE